MSWDGGGTIQVQPVELEAHKWCVSQIRAVGGCVYLTSLGLCFGEPLLATDAGELLGLVPPQNNPPNPTCVPGKGQLSWLLWESQEG